MPVFFPPLPSYSVGSVLFGGSTGFITQDNTNLFWNATTHVLKIGDASVSASRIEIDNSSNNLFLGSSATGSSLTSGSNNTLLGNWVGYVGPASNVIAISDGAGNLKLDYNFSAANAWTSPGSINVDAGAGTATARLNLTGRNAGVGTLVSIFADIDGNLNYAAPNTYISSAVTAGCSVSIISTDTGGKSFQFLATGSASGYGAGRLALWDGANYAVFSYTVSSNILALNSTEVLGWSSDIYANAAADTGFYRNAAGRIEINNGTAGTFRDLKARDVYINGATFMLRSTAAWTNGAAAALGTLANAPAAGNPTKWIAVDDNGTTRYIPAW